MSGNSSSTHSGSTGGNAKPSFAFLVIQEGGTSSELYVHGFDTLSDAQAFRLSCANKGAYRTSDAVKIPLDIADNDSFWDVIGEILMPSSDFVQIPVTLSSQNSFWVTVASVMAASKSMTAVCDE